MMNQGESGDRPSREDEIRYIRETNDAFYGRVEARRRAKESSPAAAIYYDPELSDEEKYARLQALLHTADADSPEAADAQSHLASLDGKRSGGIF